MPQLPDDEIDALLAAAEASGLGTGPAAVQALIIRTHERQRKIQHERAKAAQPKNVTLQGLKDEAWKPLSEDEATVTAGSLEYVMLSVQDELASGTVDDILFALLRVWRRAWGHTPHLGPIRPVAPQEPAKKPKGAPSSK